MTRAQASSNPAADRLRLPLTLCLAALAACGPGQGEPAEAGAPTVGSASGGGPSDPDSVGGSASEQPSEASDPADEALRRIAPVLAILTPPPPESISSETNAWLDGRRAFLEGLGGDDVELGDAMIEVLRSRPEMDRVVQRGLVEAVARTGAPSAGPLLAELVNEYGVDLGVRTTAAECLYLASPELAAETLEPLLRDPPRATYPPAESLLIGWEAAVAILERDPVDVLALVATDLRREDSARHRAVRGLGRAGSPAARAALETLMIESTGNFYLRRLAAQAVVDAFERDEACALLERVLSREADENMLIFLSNLVSLHCS